MKATKLPPAYCQRCGKSIPRGPGRCTACLGKPLRPTSPGWQRRPYFRDPAEDDDEPCG